MLALVEIHDGTPTGGVIHGRKRIQYTALDGSKRWGWLGVLTSPRESIAVHGVGTRAYAVMSNVLPGSKHHKLCARMYLPYVERNYPEYLRQHRRLEVKR